MTFLPVPSLFIASDHAGFPLKEVLKPYLQTREHDIVDLGASNTESCDYPLFAHNLCAQVLETGSMGILICGTGIGMSMAANRHPGIRAALCTHEFHASAARAHNDANILCLGARITAPSLACVIAELFLNTPFEGNRHQKRIDLIELSSSSLSTP